MLLALLLALCGSTTIAAQDTAGSIEPTAGSWPTFLLSSGSQLRLPPPPDAAATAAELGQLKALEAQRDAAALDQIAFWTAGGPIYRWNELALDQVLRTNTAVPRGSRVLAIVHTAVYDATVATWDSKYAYNRPRPSTVDPALTTIGAPPASPSYPAEHAAVAGAAAAVLAYLYPNDAATFTAQAEAAAQAQLLAGTAFPSDVAAGLALGRAVAELAIARARTDGSDQVWTGSVPTEPGHWTGTNPVEPLMGTWKTWSLASGSEFRPGPPPAYDLPQMAAEMAEVRDFVRTPKSNADAFFWEYGAGGTRGHWYWNTQATKRIGPTGSAPTRRRSARVYALESVAYYDASVACLDAKYTYWSIRPFQLDPTFRPLFTTPNHPSYPSAHGCLSGAASEVLAWLFPHDADSLRALADQAGESRLWAGIHFRSDIVVGLVIGRTVAWKTIERMQGAGR